MVNPFTVKTRDEAGNPIPYDHNQRIKEAEFELETLNTLMEKTFADHSLVRERAVAYSSNDPRCPKVCGRFDGGNRSCKHHCDQNHYLGVTRHNELRAGDIARHIAPIQRQMETHRKIIEKEKEKASLPILRNSLMTNLEAFRTLSITDPQYRQKQKNLEKELFEQSQEIDTLEKKWNIYGNIPTMKREIIRPDPIIQTKTKFQSINTRPLIIGGIVGLVGLFLIWRYS